MVSHAQKPRVGGGQEPNSPRKLRQRPKPGTRIAVCQCCGFRKQMSSGFKDLCLDCVAKVASAAKGSSNNARFDNAMATEDGDYDPMEIESVSGSNDDDRIPHSDASAHTAAATAGSLVNATDISVPAQKIISDQRYSSLNSMPPGFLGVLPPWTPAKSSTFPGARAAENHEPHVGAAANNMNHSAAMGAPVAMNMARASMNIAADYANLPEPTGFPTGTASTAMPPQTAMGQIPRNSSADTAPQASVKPPTTNMGPEHMMPRGPFHPLAAIMAPSGIMNSSAPMNPQGSVAPTTFNGPSTAMAHLRANPHVPIVARPSVIIPPAATGLTASNPKATMRNSAPVIARPRTRANPPRMRKRPSTATLPPLRPNLPPVPSPTVHISPSASESSPVANNLPATASSSASMSTPSIIISPPSTAPPAGTENPVCTNPPAVNDPQPSTSATPNPTLPVSMGPGDRNPRVNESSTADVGPTCTDHPDDARPLATTNPPEAVNPQVAMDRNPSVALESGNPPMGVHLEPYGPLPTNVGNYSSILHTNYCYTSQAAGSNPIKLDSMTKNELLSLQNYVKNPPVSSTQPFFLPPRSLSLYLLKLYGNEVHFIYPFFDMDKFMHTCIKFFMLVTKLDFSSAYAGLGCSDESNPSTGLFQCALFTILCHAVFFANLEEKDKKFASGVFWKCAKFFMTEELLKTSCVAAVQTLLIISVAYNGSTFGVKGRKIPADLACRIARSLGIDNEDDQPASAAAGVQGTNRQTWYGCIMMNLFSQTRISKLPLSHDMSSAPSVITPGQLASGSVDFSFFTNCVNRIEELEKLLEKMRRVREPILEAAPNHGYNSFDTVVPELREKLREFVDSLTSDISWGVSGLPDEYIHMHEFEKLITASNANFFYLRAMLFRPILMLKAIEGSLQSGSTSHKPDSVVMDKTLASARGCLNAAGCLIFYIYKRFWIHLNGNKEWWWSPYHTSTAGLILIMAQTSASLWSYVQLPTIQSTWIACQEILGYNAANNHFHTDALMFLWNTNSKISGNRVLENNYSAMPQMKYQMALALRNPLRTPFTIPVNPWSPSPDSKSISQPTSSDSDRKAPMEVLMPNMSPSASRNDDASSSNTAPFPASASSMDFNPMSSATSEMAPSGPSAIATTTFSNYNTNLYGSSSGSGTVPPFAASWNFDAPPITAPCNFDTAPFTALLNFDAVPPAAPSMSDSALLPTTSASTVHPASNSSGSVPSSLPLDPSMTPHVASEYAAALYNVASNPNMVPFMASSDSTIVPFATSLNWNENWNGAPCAAPSESVADPHAGPWNPNTVPAMSSSWVSPAPYAGPYTVFSDPNATLYTEESLDSNASPRSEVSAFNPPPSSSNTMPGPLPSDPNAANFGNTEGMGDLGTEPQALIQASTEDLPLNIYYNPNDDPFVTGNWQS